MAMREWIEGFNAARQIELGFPMRTGMPQSERHPRLEMWICRRHGETIREDGSSAANEIIVTGGHVGTHIDALCHVSFQGMLFGGVVVDEVESAQGFRRHGAEEIPVLVRRAVLLDVATLKGQPYLEGGIVVTARDLELAEQMTACRLEKGDVALVRTGWARWFPHTDRFTGRQDGVPGLGAEAARWLVQRGVVAVGIDTLYCDVVEPDKPATRIAHRILIQESGTYIIEVMNFEELAALRRYEIGLMVVPLRIAGATACPVRPIGLV